MQKLKGAAVVAHGGGPTAVINASLAGVIEQRRAHPEITALYGARHGILGVLHEDFLDLDRQDPGAIENLARTPGSALGSCRHKVRAEDYDRILKVFDAHQVRYFFYNGGNDSMDTAWKVAHLAEQAGYELRVIGIPKTIDNDLPETDHCPGYGSAALFYACALRDIGADLRELPGRVTVVEVMGRDAGWLTAATALARARDDDPPQLIYLPEHPVSAEKFLEDVQAVHRRLGYAVVAICEGQRDEKGEAFGADMIAADGFSHQLAGNLAHVLAQLITRRLKLRARSEKPGLLGRSSAAFVSATDREEARRCGRAAVQAAVEGVSGRMITLVREAGPEYRVRTETVELEKVANRERRFPAEWIQPAGNDVLPPFLDYVRPLVGEVAPRLRLDDVRVPKRLP